MYRLHTEIVIYKVQLRIPMKKLQFYTIVKNNIRFVISCLWRLNGDYWIFQMFRLGTLFRMAIENQFIDNRYIYIFRFVFFLWSKIYRNIRYSVVRVYLQDDTTQAQRTQCTYNIKDSYYHDENVLPRDGSCADAYVMYYDSDKQWKSLSETSRTRFDHHIYVLL